MSCREECEARGATILYATHIFDGLEPWLTHLAFVSEGKLLKGACSGLLAPASVLLLSSALTALMEVSRFNWLFTVTLKIAHRIHTG